QAAACAAPADEELNALRQALRDAEERLRCIIEFSSDYYWEQDEQHRLTLVRATDELATDVPKLLGKAPWELPDHEPVSCSWAEHRRTLAARAPLADFILLRRGRGQPDRFLSISGMPMFDAAGRFRGYRGIARDVTSEQRDQRLLKLNRTI